MPCENPLKGSRPANGGPLSFTGPKNDGRAWVDVDVPCGTCILCRTEHARQQAIRITHEASLHEENAFLNLTYHPNFLPLYGSLSTEHRPKRGKTDPYAWQPAKDRNHLSNFFKRLRRAYPHVSMRYYAVGEYGDLYHRPHYHACVFGQSFTKNRLICQQTPHLLWTSPELEQLWGFGSVRVGALNYETARYTASYVVKKLRSKQKYVRIDEKTGELIPLVQPRAYMSRNIARDWWDQHRHYVSAHDMVIINGKPQKPPKAYDRWLGEVNKLPLQMIKEQRKLKGKYLTPEETRARARNAHAHAKKKNKTL